MKKLLYALLIVPAVSFLVSCSSNAKQESEVPEQTAELVFMTNIHCDGCVNTVQTKMPDNDGVMKAVADLDTKQVKVTYDPSKIDPNGIIAAFSDLGYEASVALDEEETSKPEEPAQGDSLVE